MKVCPHCAEEIQDAAIKCRYCGSSVSDRRSDRRLLAVAGVTLVAGAVATGLVGLAVMMGLRTALEAGADATPEGPPASEAAAQAELVPMTEVDGTPTPSPRATTEAEGSAEPSPRGPVTEPKPSSADAGPAAPLLELDFFAFDTALGKPRVSPRQAAAEPVLLSVLREQGADCAKPGVRTSFDGAFLGPGSKDLIAVVHNNDCGEAMVSAMSLLMVLRDGTTVVADHGLGAFGTAVPLPDVNGDGVLEVLSLVHGSREYMPYEAVIGTFRDGRWTQLYDLGAVSGTNYEGSISYFSTVRISADRQLFQVNYHCPPHPSSAAECRDVSTGFAREPLEVAPTLPNAPRTPVSATGLRPNGCPVGASTAGAYFEGRRVVLIGLHPDDAYWGSDYATRLPIRGTVVGTLRNSAYCWFGGGFRGDDGTEFHFYKAAFRPE